MPAVSIIITCYNYAHYLPQRLESVYSQTFRDCEVIFIDDRSTDNSVEVFEKWGPKSFPTRTIYNTVNSGNAFLQWIKGLDIAQGEFIWMADADDLAEPTLLETSVKLLRRNPQVSMAYVQSIAIDKDGQPQGIFQHVANFKNPEIWEKDFIQNHPEEWASHLLLNCDVGCPSSAVFRKSHYKNYAKVLPNYRIMGDWISWLNLLRHGALAFTAAPLNYYRCHAGSLCRSTKNVRPSYFERTHLTGEFLDEWEAPQKLRREIYYELLEFWYYAFVIIRDPKITLLEVFRAYVSGVRASHVDQWGIVCETARWLLCKLRSHLGKGRAASHHVR